MTFYKQFILDLQEVVKSQVPEFRYVDQNLGQWGNDNFKVAVSLPAILVDFPNTGYSELANGSDLGSTEVKLTLFWDVNSQSYNIAPTNVKNKALEYYEMEKKLVRVLKTWTTDYFTKLVRTNAVSRNQNELGLRIRELSFATEHEEYLEDETEQTVEFTIDFSGQIQEITPAD